MSGWTDRTARRALLEEYLLGTLDEGARAVLRAQAIGSPQVFAEVCDVERDLLDARARGALDERRAHLVDTRLAGPHGEAWLLAQALAERAAVAASGHPLAWSRIARVGVMEIVPADPSADFWARTRFFPAAAGLVVAASLWVAMPRTPGGPTPIPGGAAPTTPTSLQQAALEARHTLILRADAHPSPTPESMRVDRQATTIRIDINLPGLTVDPALAFVDVAVDVNDDRGRRLWAAERVRAAAARAGEPVVATIAVPLASLVPPGQTSPSAGVPFRLVVRWLDRAQPDRTVSFLLQRD